MKTYEIEIKETLSRMIEVDAKSIDEAFTKVKKQYKDEEIILDDSDYVNTEFIKALEE